MKIKEQFSLTISTVGYGGRKYYGDIAYCEMPHNMAVFYAQTDHPNLSVDMIPVGKITSDLAVFDTLDSRESIVFSPAE